MTTIPLNHPAPVTPALRTFSLSLLLGAAVGLGFGTIECYAHTIPSEPLMVPTEIVATITFATALGSALIRLFRALPTRSRSLTRLCTLSACLIAYYCAWAAWIANFVYYFSGEKPLPAYFTPARVLSIATAMNYLGTWNLFEKPAHGPLLTSIWFAELFTLFALTTRLVEWKCKIPKPTPSRT